MRRITVITQIYPNHMSYERMFDFDNFEGVQTWANTYKNTSLNKNCNIFINETESGIFITFAQEDFGTEIFLAALKNVY